MRVIQGKRTVEPHAALTLRVQSNCIVPKANTSTPLPEQFKPFYGMLDQIDGFGRDESFHSSKGELDVLDINLHS